MSSKKQCSTLSFHKGTSLPSPPHIGAQALPLNALWTPAKSQYHISSKLSIPVHILEVAHPVFAKYVVRRTEILKNDDVHQIGTFNIYTVSSWPISFQQQKKGGVMTRQEWHKAKKKRTIYIGKLVPSPRKGHVHWENFTQLTQSPADTRKAIYKFVRFATTCADSTMWHGSGNLCYGVDINVWS